MKKDRYKLRVIALLIAAGFVGGLFVQYKAPGTFVLARTTHAKGKKIATAGDAGALGQDGGGIAPRAAPPNASPPSAAETQAAQAQEQEREEAARRAQEESRRQAAPPEDATPALLRGEAAIAVIVGNTLEIAEPGGEKRQMFFAPRGVLFFASRGVTADFGESIEARFWARADDRLCRNLGAHKRECFYFVVHLDERLRQGSLKTLPARIEALKVGAPIGDVEGFGEGGVKLLRGNVRDFPGYAPLLEGKPGPEWTAERSSARENFVGALLLRRHGDEGRAATFFAPNGQVLEVSRLTRETVSLKIGAWRRLRDLVCRRPAPQNLPGDLSQKRDLAIHDNAEDAAPDEECAHARVTGARVEFPEAGPGRRAYIRAPWADEDPEPLAPTAEVDLATPTHSRAPINATDSFTDLR